MTPEGDDWLEVVSADETREGDREARVRTGSPIYLNPGTNYVYWSDSTQTKYRGVYNIPPERTDEIVERIKSNRSAEYLDLVGDVPGAGYGDQNSKIQLVEGSAGA